MKKNLLLLALLALTATPVRAEVLIYKGTGTVATVPGFLVPPKFSTYFVADIANKQIGLVVFFKANGQKSQLPGVPFAIDTTTAPVEGGGTARIFATGGAPQPAPNFNYSNTFFRGIQKTVVVATGATDVTRNEPRVIKGGVRNASESTGSGNFADLQLTVLFQQRATIQANNDARTLEQTLSDLSAALTEKGYQVIIP